MPITQLKIVASILIGAGAFAILISNVLFFAILAQVNKSIEPQSKISPFFPSFNFIKVVSLHKQQFPKEAKRTWMYVFLGIGGTLIFTAWFFLVLTLEDVRVLVDCSDSRCSAL